MVRCAALASYRIRARRPLAKHVPEARAVAEPFELRAQRRSVRAVLRGRHVAHVGSPAARVPAALQALALAAPHGRGVFVAVVAVLGRESLQQPIAAGVRTASIDDAW